MITRWLPAVAVVMLMGCAIQPVKPLYVSAAQYQSFDCGQLRAEHARISLYLKNGVDVPSQRSVGVGFGLGGVLGHGGGIVPSISIHMGQSSNSPRTEYAKLLGQQEAVVQAAAFKGCALPTANPAVRQTGTSIT
jgi:hypothetical protein